MVTGAEYGQALRDILEYINTTGDEVVAEIDAETEEGISLDGYRVQHGNHVYDIIGSPDDDGEYFRASYPYDAVQAYAQRLAVEEYDGEITDGSEIEVDPDTARARLDQLAASNPDSYANLANQLRETIQSPHTSFNIDATENGGIAGFQVNRKLFVYEDEFRASTLGHTSQMVVSIGLQGRILMEDAYSIPRSIQEAVEGEPAETDDPSQRYLG